jgi:hypothetical protein
MSVIFLSVKFRKDKSKIKELALRLPAGAQAAFLKLRNNFKNIAAPDKLH